MSVVITSTNAKNQKSPEDFFTMPHMVMAKINPAGNTVAAINIEDGKQKLIAIDTKTNMQIGLIDLKNHFKGQASITALVWLDNHHIAAQLIENKRGIEDLLNTKKNRRLVIVRRPLNKEKVKIYSIKTKGWLVHALPDQENRFLYAKSGIYSKVYSISINKLAQEGKRVSKLSKVDGGQFKKSNVIADVEGFSTRWFFTPSGEIKATLHYGKDEQLLLSAIGEDDATEVINTWPKYEASDEQELEDEIAIKRLIPIALTNEKNSFYCIDVNEVEPRNIYKVNFDSNEQELVYQSDSYRIVDIELSANADRISSVKLINDGQIETVYIGNEQNSNKQQNSQHFESEISLSQNKNIAVVYKESHVNPGAFYLTDKTSSNTSLLGYKYPQLGVSLSSKLIQSSIDVSDLAIPYLLSLPQNSEYNLPLIVMPHGGPIGPYDNQYYDPIVQYFNANGYAVLRVNFRGSGGYSEALKEAGKKQWGKLMLEDIYQASKKVIARKEINDQRVCIFGMSYGGYAATMLATKYPETYKCGASWAGVTDINLYLNGNSLSNKQLKWSRKYIGDSEKEFMVFKKESPVYNVQELKVPLFIAHGIKDTVVDIEHAYRMKHMLDKYQKSYQWYIDDSSPHGFSDMEKQQLYFKKLKDFIQKNIG